MSGYLGQGRYGGSAFDAAPNVLIDLAKIGQGQRDAMALQQAEQQNALMRLKMDAEQEALSRDASFRAIAPGVMQGNPDAFQSATGVDPERAAKLRAAYEGFGDDQRKRALQNLDIMGRGAFSLLELPEDQAPAAYTTMLGRLRQAGIDTSALPAAYPGRAAIEQFTRGLLPLQEQLQRRDAQPRPAGQSYEDRIIMDESGGNPNARNPLSSAGGAAQFLDGTWMEFAAAHPELFKGMTREQILAARNDLDLSKKATRWYATQNTPFLTRAGIDPTEANLALAHKFGPGGAVQLLTAHRANPNAPMPSVVSEDVIKRNPDLAARTVGDVVAATERRYQPRPMTDARGMPIVVDGKELVAGPDGAPTWRVSETDMEVSRRRMQEKADASVKSLPSSDRKTLLEAGGKTNTFDNLFGTFDDRFGGYGAAWAADIDLFIKRNAAGDPSSAKWWSTYQEIKNQVRNDLFGAALTAAEKSEFEKSAINPGMRPELIKSYLERQRAVLRSALDRHASSLVQDGYRRTAIEEAMGRKIGADAAPAGNQAETIAVNPQTGARLRLNRQTNKWEPMQ